MKSVLISIQPKWCELIANGKKILEVRKTRPNIKTPFKCYIYCTSSNVHECLMLNKSGATLIHSINYKKAIPCGGNIANGKVIGEFVCKSTLPISITYSDPNNKIALREFPYTCLTDKEIMNYLGNGKQGWGWHISNLVIYDKPKELSSFSVIDDKAVKECRHRKRIYVNPNSVNGAWLKGSYICTKGEEDWCSKCKTKPITRPPQSWCYVEKMI